eukprot:TRINITY_DN13408_c0_g1_i9.p1 TRINITY_DN13408_c0_g1~~TRINITY_DN13408_c0_g1_i9.p1  ORF type:complete len:646 (-),score=129.84 TRINITY_DN13408_c0_g1_i9:791-2728(-)
MEEDLEDDSSEVFEIFDYTIASPWEQLIADMEQGLRRSGLGDGDQNLCELEYRAKGYTMMVHAHHGDGAAGFREEMFSLENFLSDDAPHTLARRFGVSQFICLTHADADIIEADEANTLLSALAVASQNTSCAVPCFVAVHSPAKKAFCGMLGAGEIMVRFDCSSSNDIPSSARHLSGLLDMFAARLGLQPAGLCQVHIGARFCFTLSRNELPPEIESVELWTSWPGFQEGRLVENPVHTDLHPMEAPLWCLKLHSSATQRPLTCKLVDMLSRVQQPRGPVVGLPLEHWQLQGSKPAPCQICPGLRGTTGHTALDLVVDELLDAPPEDALAIWVGWVECLRQRWESRSAVLALPPNPSTGALGADHSMCLAFQKLQLLDACIHLLTGGGQAAEATSDDDELFEDASDAWGSPAEGDSPPILESLRGQLGVKRDLPGLWLLSDPNQPLREPRTRVQVVLSEDLVMEEQEVLLGTDGQEARVAQQSDGLRSDMQCFKFANPGAQLEDFVRWHSPRDWVQDDQGQGKLSERMSSQDNLWHQLWSESEPIRASEQPAVLDAHAYGEAVVQWFECLSGEELAEQLFVPAFMVCTRRLITLQEGLVKDGLMGLSAGSEDWMDVCCDRLGHLEMMVAETSALSKIWPGCGGL